MEKVTGGKTARLSFVSPIQFHRDIPTVPVITCAQQGKNACFLAILGVFLGF
ncbi:MAG: hypothetical protein PHC42_00790 [Bacilli bacterium]|nr:hypothetical protein [Bacilli bacterium]